MGKFREVAAGFATELRLLGGLEALGFKGSSERPAARTGPASFVRKPDEKLPELVLELSRTNDVFTVNVRAEPPQDSYDYQSTNVSAEKVADRVRDYIESLQGE